MLQQKIYLKKLNTKPGMVEYTLNSNTQEAETDISVSQSKANLAHRANSRPARVITS